MTQKKPETSLLLSGRSKKYSQGAVNSIIQRTSSVIFDTVAQKREATQKRAEGALFYGRRGTTTHFALQEALTELEQGTGCALFPSGAAAITQSILAFIEQGCHILVTGSAYDPTQNFCDQILSKFSVTTTYFDPLIGTEISQLLRPETKIVFLESPGSITMEVQDLQGIITAVRHYNPNIIIMIDNTWAAGLLLKPLTLGADISIQSATKYIIGHSDGMLGFAVANQRCWPQLRENTYLLGQCADPDTAYMAARGLRTLAVRMKQHEQSGLEIARWLKQHPLVDNVYHPALSSCPGHTYFQRDFTGSNGLFSFSLKKILTTEEFSRFLDNLSLFKMAFSWGGFESLILGYHPNDIKAMRQYDTQPTLAGTLFRVHIGLENIDDLIEDLEQAFLRISD
ncbi:cystathionine beta-lyase [Proteus mirabilis]|nr:cystathionine beta-lyase [Proteus mirabilis]